MNALDVDLDTLVREAAAASAGSLSVTLSFRVPEGLIDLRLLFSQALPSLRNQIVEQLQKMAAPAGAPLGHCHEGDRKNPFPC